MQSCVVLGRTPPMLQWKLTELWFRFHLWKGAGYGCGSKTLVNGNMDQNLRNPLFNFEPHPYPKVALGKDVPRPPDLWAGKQSRGAEFEQGLGLAPASGDSRRCVQNVWTWRSLCGLYIYAFGKVNSKCKTASLDLGPVRK